MTGQTWILLFVLVSAVLVLLAREAARRGDEARRIDALERQRQRLLAEAEDEDDDEDDDEDEEDTDDEWKGGWLR